MVRHHLFADHAVLLLQRHGDDGDGGDVGGVMLHHFFADHAILLLQPHVAALEPAHL